MCSEFYKTNIQPYLFSSAKYFAYLERVNDSGVAMVDAGGNYTLALSRNTSDKGLYHLVLGVGLQVVVEGHALSQVQGANRAGD